MKSSTGKCARAAALGCGSGARSWASIASSLRRIARMAISMSPVVVIVRIDLSGGYSRPFPCALLQTELENRELRLS